MAIYHLNAKIIKRQGNGEKRHSSVSAAAYRHRAEMTHGGEKFRYTRKNSDLVDEFIMSPDLENNWIVEIANSPAPVAERSEKIWQFVELMEKRKDAQLAREIEVSLHHELTIEQNKELLKTFIQKNFIEKGMVADVAIHNPGNNLHAHIMLTMRDLEGQAFGKKNREWNNQDLILEWRKSWEIESNLVLQAYSPETPQISCETLAKQRENALAIGNYQLAAELDREPVRHLKRDNYKKLNFEGTYIPKIMRSMNKETSDNAFKKKLLERTQQRLIRIKENVIQYFENRHLEFSQYFTNANNRVKTKLRDARNESRNRLKRERAITITTINRLLERINRPIEQPNRDKELNNKNTQEINRNKEINKTETPRPILKWENPNLYKPPVYKPKF